MDQQLLFLINDTWARPWLDYGMAVASSFDFWWPILLLGGVAVAIFGGFRGRMFLVAVGLAVGITDAVVVDTLKGVVGRPRPNEVLEGVRVVDLAPTSVRLMALAEPLRVKYSAARIRPPHGNSFPSGHAANNFAVAAVAAVFFRRWGWIALVPAAVVGYSRVYVGSHWPSDVLVSAFLGAAIGVLVAAALEAIWRRCGERWLPEVFRGHPTLFAA